MAESGRSLLTAVWMYLVTTPREVPRLSGSWNLELFCPISSVIRNHIGFVKNYIRQDLEARSGVTSFFGFLVDFC
jgi:hypothetical protein